MKHIIITSCGNCHLKEYRGEFLNQERIFCTNKLTYGVEIEDLDKIPDWCMLDDVEGE